MQISLSLSLSLLQYVQACCALDHPIVKHVDKLSAWNCMFQWCLPQTQQDDWVLRSPKMEQIQLSRQSHKRVAVNKLTGQKMGEITAFVKHVSDFTVRKQFVWKIHVQYTIHIRLYHQNHHHHQHGSAVSSFNWGVFDKTPRWSLCSSCQLIRQHKKRRKRRWL